MGTEVWCSWTENAAEAELDYVTTLAAEAYGIRPNALVKSPKLLVLFLREGDGPLSCSIAIRREAIERIGGFGEGLRGPADVPGDWITLAKVCLELPVFVSTECWARYRQHPDSRTAQAVKSGGRDSAVLSFANWLETYMTLQGGEDAELRQALQETLWRCRHPTLHRLCERTAWTRLQASMLLSKLVCRAFGVSIGSVLADPRAIRASRPGLQVTTLSWSSRGTDTVEVRVDGPDGPLFSRTGSSGTKTTGEWVRDGTIFYLQDASGGLPLTSTNTLAVVRVRVTSGDDPDQLQAMEEVAAVSVNDNH